MKPKISKTIVAGGFALTGFVINSFSQSPTFSAPIISPVGLMPQGLAVGDFNEDGKPDFVSADSGSNAVTWRLGNGNGAFSGSLSAPVGLEPVAAEVADLNGDGHVDITIANYTGGSASILIGDGLGLFAAQTEFPAGLQPGAIAFGDVNEDGNVDIAFSNFITHAYATILIGDGQGSFAAPAFKLLSSNRPVSVAVRDLDSDGNLDLLVVTSHAASSFLNVCKGDGQGLFAAETTFQVAPYPSGIGVTDMNHDGNDDVVTANYQPAGITILSGDGSGSFAPMQFFLSAGQYSLGVGAADFDADGNLDIATANGGTNDISIFQGNGAGGFTNVMSVGCGTAPQPLVCADVNGDSSPDILAANYGSNDVYVLLNTTGPPVGVSAYGFGTPGCHGPHILSALNAPYIGNPNFTVRSTNAPANGLGGWWITDSQDVAGTDVFNVGIKLHIDFYNATELFIFDIYSDAAGVGTASAPIPNDPNLVGHTYYAQTIWSWPLTACQLFPYGLSSSNGLGITVQP